MPKFCKRIIALVAVSCLVLVSCPLAFAEDSYVAQHKPTVWEHIIDSTGSTMRSLFNSVVGVFIGTDYCAFTDSKKHEGTEVVSKEIGSDGEYIFFIRCTGCGKTFAYKGSDAQKQYNDSIHSSGLVGDDDHPIGVSPRGTLIYYLDAELGSFDGSNAFNPSLFDLGSSFRYAEHSFSFDAVAKQTSTNSFISLRFSFVFPYSGLCRVYGFKSIGASSLNHFTDSFTCTKGASYTFSYNTPSGSLSFSSGSIFEFIYGPIYVEYFRIDDDSSSLPSVPTTININNTTYNVTDIDLETRTVHTTENYTIEYGDTEIKIYDGPTEIKVIQYVIENPNPDPDPGPGGDSSDPDPGPGGDSSDPDPGPGGGTSGGSGCCEQCALLLRQANQYLLQIQTLVDQINDKLGDDGDNYTQGIYNLLIEIKSALENLPSEPHKDYEEKLNLIANQLANIWGDLETIKTSLSAVETNTAETNEKLDSVHEDLEAVLAELQTQRGILQQILDTLKKILGHVETIDGNVEELKDEESSNNFFNNFILKFHFLGDIFSIVRQLFADITNDAATVQLVDDGTLPIGDLSSQHFPIDGSPVAIGTAPEVLTRFPDDKYHGVDLSSYSALDLSWYARYKSRVDALLSGFLWIGYIWLLFKRAPGIVRGAAMVDETNIKIDDFRNGG